MPHREPRPRVGDTCWFIEWTTKRGLVDDDHPEYGGNPDKDVTRSRRVASRDQAVQSAREVYPLDQYGAVRFWPVQFTPYDEDDQVTYPHTGYWATTGEVEFYEE